MSKLKLLLFVLFCYVELFNFTLGHPKNIHGLIQNSRGSIKHEDPSHGTRSRHKRQILDFSALPETKWTLPINYKIKSDISIQKEIIHRAIEAWENVTCVKFHEIPYFTYLSAEQHHLIFQNGYFWCSSHVGMSDKEQSIGLSSDCISVGTVMHEIGHALGLYHEMQRLDRDKYVQLSLGYLDKNINYGYPENDTKTDGVPFDLASIMEYPAMVPSAEKDYISTSMISMLPRKHRKVFVMGQRMEIGFYDAKIINIEYCGVTNNEKLPCKHDGYPDPLAPGRCRCLPEWSGQYCQLTSPSSTGCSPYIGHHKHAISDVGKEFSLYTPNYLNNNHDWSFSSGDQCFWYIQVPPKYQIAWWIDTTHDNSGTGVYLGMYLENTSCQAWLEIRKGAETRGQRICGLFDSENHLTNGSRPVLSHSHKLHISFRSFALFKQTLPALIRRGFFLKYTFVSKQLKYKTNIPLKDEVKYVLDSWKRLDPRNRSKYSWL